MTHLNLDDMIAELELVSTQAEAIASDLGRMARSGDIKASRCFAKLQSITCRFETAATFVRAIIS